MSQVLIPENTTLLQIFFFISTGYYTRPANILGQRRVRNCQINFINTGDDRNI